MGAGHPPQTVYWEEWGVPDGLPALYLHGGPGGGLGSSRYRDRFDLSRWRVIGIEQRGCGRSRPLAIDDDHDLASNDTGTLIADIEAVRRRLGIERWIVSGVSWGSTLALAYGRAHADRVAAIVCMAVTTTCSWEVQWITEGVAPIYPEAWERLAAFAGGHGYEPGKQRLIDVIARLIADPATRARTATEWCAWEDAHVGVGAGGPSHNPRFDDPEYRDTFALLVTHYWSHSGFVDPPLIDQPGALTGIPVVLIHGRRDVSGPVHTAWRMHRALPSSRLVVIEDEGHGGPEMVATWTEALAELAETVEADAS